MFRVAILGHSQVPEVVEGPNLDIRVFRKPGGFWYDLFCPQFSDFCKGGFDLAIIVLGGNDLAGNRPVLDIVEDAKVFVKYASECARHVRVCTAESRTYPENNRFGVSNSEYKARKNRYNRMLLRMLKRENARAINLERPWFKYERKSDGVHFSTESLKRFARELVRVSLGVKGSVS